MISQAVVLALFEALYPGASHQVSTKVIDAISKASLSNDDASLLSTYAWLESRGKEFPVPVSWDAIDGRSCGPWQLPCKQVSNHSIYYQARLWLKLYHTYGLYSLDSSVTRANKRLEKSLDVLSYAYTHVKNL